MPKQDLSDEEISDLIAFLDWVSNVDNQGWPPRPILVTGATIPGTDMTRRSRPQRRRRRAAQAPPGARPVTGDENPMALGEALFRSATPACNACHSVAPGVNMAGPSLAGVGDARRTGLIASPDYKGKAKDVAGYIRESIVEPSAHLVPGAMYSANGVSFMPNTYGKSLTAGADRPARGLSVVSSSRREETAMRYKSQSVAYWYFAVAMVLFGLQLVFGLLSAAKYLGPDPLLYILPFDVTKVIHTNLLIVWVLTGFMGATYWMVPDESRTELHSVKLAYIQLGAVGR